MPTPRQIGMTLRRHRRDRRLSRAALAQAAGVSREYIRLLEAGDVNVTVALLQRLARALGLDDVTELLR
jgi:transcriptional regulator with XRE-family HTH domain